MLPIAPAKAPLDVGADKRSRACIEAPSRLCVYLGVGVRKLLLSEVAREDEQFVFRRGTDVVEAPASEARPRAISMQ